MSKYIKRRLITWEEFKRRYKPYAIEWDDDNGIYEIEYKEWEWSFDGDDKEDFGKEILVRKLDEYKYSNYTHEDKETGYGWHELWFEPEFKPIEFIGKKEMEL